MSKEEDILIEIRDALQELVHLSKKQLKIMLATDTTGRAKKIDDLNGQTNVV